MTTIKKTLERIIRDNDFLEDGLYHGYINLTSLAAYLLPLIQSFTKKNTTIPSLTMTLSRIASDLQKSLPRPRIRPEDIRVRSGISYVTFPKVKGLTSMLNDIATKLKATEKTGSQLFSQLEGSREITVLYTSFFTAVMSEISEEYPPKVHISWLVALVIQLPPETLEEKGILYYVVKQLNYFGVNIMELYTTHTELTVVIRREDMGEAMKILG